MGVHNDLRTPDEVLCDMIADGDDSNEMWVRIAARLQRPVHSCRNRFKAIEKQMGWQTQ